MFPERSFPRVNVACLLIGSTNVYEEKSLGVFAEDQFDGLEEPTADPESSRTAIWGKYLAWHMRKQLSFGALQSFLFTSFLF